ncbi:hypothetical protein AB1K01_08895 [Pseudomonas paraeruginosa]|uniref:hypothetical protein n=1 Tax=Pseudomonas TaxID=286 RepID=UPI002093052A|nr:hypothetical protein [Pseudomonas kermanshahensis]USS56561.1 hypothetical protein NG836_06555 [Pseudomonas kermanshahensis]
MNLIPTKAEIMEVLEQAAREVVVSFIVGGVPLLIFAPTSKVLKELVNASLAPVPLMKWYACLMIPLCVGAILAKFFNMRRGRTLRASRWFFRILSDSAGTMASAIQLALGAALGFVVTWQSAEPETLTGLNALSLSVTILSMLTFSVMLSVFLPILRNPRTSGQSRAQNVVWVD